MNPTHYESISVNWANEDENVKKRSDRYDINRPRLDMDTNIDNIRIVSL